VSEKFALRLGSCGYYDRIKHHLIAAVFVMKIIVLLDHQRSMFICASITQHLCGLILSVFLGKNSKRGTRAMTNLTKRGGTMLRAAAFDCIVFAAGAAATACETALLEFAAATSRQLLLSLSILLLLIE
jgi:hypothetical protein